jgi:cytochrome d ubiquinol oxidase subunit II
VINTLWFIVLTLMLTGYAVLDGFDLGVGALHLIVGRTARERATLIDSIGPVWNGNEVWLIAAGGAMFAAFPQVYAASFSGFYLALVLVLWLLLLRGVGIEFRHQIDHPMWHEIWDIVFAAASALLAVLLGVAFSNVLRGVPLDQNGEFQGSFALMLNPFALLGGLFSLAVLSLHGATWLGLKTSGVVRDRARRLARPLWWVAMALLIAMVAASAVVRPDFAANFIARPLALVAPLIALTAAVTLRVFLARGEDVKAFSASAVFIGGVLGSAAAGLYPRLLPSRPGGPHPGLDIYNAASAPNSLWIAFGVYLFGMTLVTVYLVNVYRIWRGRL